MASGATLQQGNPYAEPTGASSGHFPSPVHPYLSVSTPKFIADSLGPVSMPPGNEPYRGGGEDSLWTTTHEEEEDHNEP
jgi:hypothetical protein